MAITDPTDISDCELWLAADNIVGLSDGDPVSTWEDESGNGRDATATSTARPTYKTGIVPTSLKPVLRFDGSNDRMSLPNFLSGFSAGEMFVVAQHLADPPTSGGTQGPITKTGGDGISHEPYVDGVVYSAFGTTSRKTAGNPTPSLSSAFRFWDFWSATNDWAIEIDGASLFSTGTNTVIWSSAPEIAHDSAFFFAGDIAEIILFSRKLSGTERTDVLDYLDDKYNSSGAPPAGNNINLLRGKLRGGLLLGGKL